MRKNNYSNIILSVLLVSMLFSCVREERGLSSNMNTEIPEHLQDIENLTIFPVESEPEFNIQLIRDQVFPESDDVLIAVISGITVDERGRVFIVELEKKTVHAFNPDGDYITNIGREGRGPGEFGSFQLKTPIFHDLSNLYVYDSSLRRINIYSLESLEYTDTIVLDPAGFGSIANEIESATPMPYSIRQDSSFIVSFQPYPSSETESFTRYYKMSASGQIQSASDSIFTEKKSLLLSQDPRIPLALPRFFSRRTLMDVSNDDHIYSAWSEELLVKVYDSNGNYLRAFYHPFAKRELSRDYAIEHVHETARDAVQDFNDLPNTWPALYSLQVDDEDRIWIATITDEDDVYNYWVLNSDGRLLAKFDWPKVNTRYFGELQIQEIRDNYLYFRETDNLGLETIVRYRIEMERN